MTRKEVSTNPRIKEAILSAHLQAIGEQTERECATYAKDKVPPLHLGIVRRHLSTLWSDAYSAGLAAGMSARTHAVLSRLILPCTPDNEQENAHG